MVDAIPEPLLVRMEDRAGVHPEDDFADLVTKRRQRKRDSAGRFVKETPAAADTPARPVSAASEVRKRPAPHRRRRRGRKGNRRPGSGQKNRFEKSPMKRGKAGRPEAAGNPRNSRGREESWLETPLRRRNPDISIPRTRIFSPASSL
jgi:hypothetical protein